MNPRRKLELTGSHQVDGGKPDASLVAFETQGGEPMIRIAQPGSPGGAMRLSGQQVDDLREWLENG